MGYTISREDVTAICRFISAVKLGIVIRDDTGTTPRVRNAITNEVIRVPYLVMTDLEFARLIYDKGWI